MSAAAPPQRVEVRWPSTVSTLGGMRMSKSDSYKRGLEGKAGARSGFSLNYPTQDEKDAYEQGKIDRARIAAEKQARLEADKKARE